MRRCRGSGAGPLYPAPLRKMLTNVYGYFAFSSFRGLTFDSIRGFATTSKLLPILATTLKLFQYSGDEFLRIASDETPHQQLPNIF